MVEVYRCQGDADRVSGGGPVAHGWRARSVSWHKIAARVGPVLVIPLPVGGELRLTETRFKRVNA